MKTCHLWSEATSTVAGDVQETYFGELHEVTPEGIGVKYNQMHIPHFDLK